MCLFPIDEPEIELVDSRTLHAYLYMVCALAA